MGKSPHEELYEEASEAATKLYSDTSVSQEDTRRSLQTLRGEIDTMIETINADLGDD